MNLALELERYFERADRTDGAVLQAQFERVLALGPEGFRRHCFQPGHFTASVWLLHPDRSQVLLTHHRKLARWLQLGGHADGEEDLRAVALREAEEESGLDRLTLDPEIFDVDVHTIPRRTTGPDTVEPEHWHLDVRFIVYHDGHASFRVSEESLALAWVPIADLLGEPTEMSIRRMAKLWLQRQ